MENAEKSIFTKKFNEKKEICTGLPTTIRPNIMVDFLKTC